MIVNKDEIKSLDIDSILQLVEELESSVDVERGEKIMAYFMDNFSDMLPQTLIGTVINVLMSILAGSVKSHGMNEFVFTELCVASAMFMQKLGHRAFESYDEKTNTFRYKGTVQ